ncbi:MAG: OmpH family outer membrane protein [Deltaproteobacteria bacterium]|nr:OmpH family outer membrane protein [Deltaproteobacteria bacterium]
MNRHLLSFALSCIILPPVAAWAGEGKVTKTPLYVVDMQRVLDDSIAGKAARNNMKDEVKKREGKLQVKRLELQKINADIEKQSALLSEDALRDKRAMLERKARDFERDVQEEREDLARKNEEEIGKIVRNAQEALAKIAADDKLPFVLERGDGFVVFANEQFDLTARVVKALDSKSLG